MKAFGIKSPETKKEPKVLWIFQDNEEALGVFMAMSTQWNVGGMGSIVGLNYVSLGFVMNTLKVKDREDCFFRIRIMESEVLKVIKEQESKK